MKTYGVNWFLVWVALMIYCFPFCAWLRELIYFRSDHPLNPHSAVWVSVSMQALFLSSALTFYYHSDYSKALADPKALYLRQQGSQQNQSFWNFYHHRFRWLAIVFAIVAATSVGCKVIFGWPSWTHVTGYVLSLPCSCLAFIWLLNKAASKGQLSQLLRDPTG